MTGSLATATLPPPSALRSPLPRRPQQMGDNPMTKEQKMTMERMVTTSEVLRRRCARKNDCAEARIPASASRRATATPNRSCSCRKAMPEAGRRKTSA